MWTCPLLKINFTQPYDYSALQILANKEVAQLALKFPDKLFYIEEPLMKQPISIGVQKSDPDTLAYLNNWITVVRNQGFIKEKADRRPESFIPLLRDKSFVVFLPCRKAMAFACQPLIAGRQKENQFVSIREHSWTNICFFH